MDKNIFEKVKDVASKTIGFDIEPVRTETIEGLYERLEALENLVKSKLSDDEYIAYGFSLDTGKATCRIEKKPLEIEEGKWVRDLTDTDLKILKDHGIYVLDMLNGRLKYGYAKGDNSIFIIRTSDASWKNLCGREWHYNITTGECKLVKMN